MPHKSSLSQPHDADTIALKQRMQKYANMSPSKNEDDCVSTSSKTATSQEDDKGEKEA